MKKNNSKRTRVHAQFFASIDAYERGDEPLGEYTFNPKDDTERRTMGARCADGYEQGWCIKTWVE